MVIGPHCTEYGSILFAATETKVALVISPLLFTRAFDALESRFVCLHDR